MAYADYWHCDMCDAKAFYDAGLDYEESSRRGDPKLVPGHNCGDLIALCCNCAKTHRIVVQKRDGAEGGA